ncbi:cytochrome c oxidase accessory protein CcoG [soil metagenome]
MITEPHISSFVTEEKDVFRDTIATITKEGKRNFLYPKMPKGKLYNARKYTGYVYLMIFLTLPFIKYQGDPLFMINVIERKFIIFGMVFWPQDFFLFALALITFITGIILFTVVYGRAFCGWACPQTIFMEMVFRRIEYFIDGDGPQQKILKAAPLTADKIAKRTTKALIFYFVSFIIANYFLAYIISMDEVLRYVNEPFSKHVGTLISLLVFTTIFFFVYWSFREQVCLVVCPYGRLQGVLLDKNSIVVAYDHERGEGRKKLDKREVRTAGDCVDCFQCVKVCPTGIDIRNGTQLECVNCTACIDACNNMMQALGWETGLIRYASENNIEKNEKFRFTPRIKAYTGVLLVMFSVLITLLTTRSDVEATLLRTAAQTYQQQPNGKISNLYSLKLANKTRKDLPVSLRLENMKGDIMLIGDKNILVLKGDYKNETLFITLNRSDLKDWKTKLTIGLYEGDEKIKTITTSFLGPEVYN